jgi:hypothetical protein
MDASEWNDERRSALHDMTEAERYLACNHTQRRGNGVCTCGDTLDREEA